MTRSSGTRPLRARSNVVRITPFARASGHSSATNAEKVASCALEICPKTKRASSPITLRLIIWDHPFGSGSYRMLRQRYQPRAVAFNTAGDLEFEQHGAHSCGRDTHLADQVVDGNRRRAEQRDNAVAPRICREWVALAKNCLRWFADEATSVLSQYRFDGGN